MSVKHLILTSAKSYIGKAINIHLLDGSVIVNVCLESIEDKAFLKCRLPDRSIKRVLLHDVVWVESVSPYLCLGVN